MIRKATQIAVPIIGSAGIDIKSLTIEYESAMKNLNEKLANGWKIFSTHAVNNNLTSYIVYVLTKIEFTDKDFVVEEGKVVSAEQVE